MDDIEKSRIRLKHWIEHNIEHMKGYDEVAQILEKNEFKAAADMIRRGTRLIGDANLEFEKAFKAIAGENSSKFGSSEALSSETHSHD